MSLNAHLLVLLLIVRIPVVLLSLHHVAKHDLDDSEKELTRTKRSLSPDDKAARKLARWPRDRVWNNKTAENKTINKILPKHQPRPYAREQAQDIKIQIKLKQQWRSKMAEKSSSEFKLLDGNVIDAVANELESDRNFIEVRVLNFSSSNGFVLANIGVIFFKTEDDPVSHLESIVATGWISGMPVFKDVFKVLHIRRGNDNGKSQGWNLAGRGPLRLVPAQTTTPPKSPPTTQQKKAMPMPLKYKEVRIAFKLKQIWHPFLGDKSATSFVVLSGNIEQAVDRAFMDYPNYIDTTTLGFSESSEHHVVVYISVRFKDEEPHPTDAVKKIIRKGSLSGMPVHTGYFVVLLENDVTKDEQRHEQSQPTALPKLHGNPYNDMSVMEDMEEEIQKQGSATKPAVVEERKEPLPSFNKSSTASPESEEAQFENQTRQEMKETTKNKSTDQQQEGSNSLDEQRKESFPFMTSERIPNEKNITETTEEQGNTINRLPSEMKNDEQKAGTLNSEENRASSNKTLHEVLKEGLAVLGNLFGLNPTPKNKSETVTTGSTNQSSILNATSESETMAARPDLEKTDTRIESQAVGRLPGQEATTGYGIIGPDDKEIEKIADTINKTAYQGPPMHENVSYSFPLSTSTVASSTDVTEDYSVPNATAKTYENQYQNIENLPSAATAATVTQDMSVTTQKTAIQPPLNATNGKEENSAWNRPPNIISPYAQITQPVLSAVTPIAAPIQQELPQGSNGTESKPNLPSETKTGTDSHEEPLPGGYSPYPVPLPPEAAKQEISNSQVYQENQGTKVPETAFPNSDILNVSNQEQPQQSSPSSNVSLQLTNSSNTQALYPISSNLEEGAKGVNASPKQETAPLISSYNPAASASIAVPTQSSEPLQNLSTANNNNGPVVQLPDKSAFPSSPESSFTNTEQTVSQYANTQEYQGLNVSTETQQPVGEAGNIPSYTNQPASQYPQNEDQNYRPPPVNSSPGILPSSSPVLHSFTPIIPPVPEQSQNSPPRYDSYPAYATVPSPTAPPPLNTGTTRVPIQEHAQESSQYPLYNTVSETSQQGQSFWPETNEQENQEKAETVYPTSSQLLLGTKQPATLPTDWEHEVRGKLKLQQIWIPELAIPQSAPYRALQNSVVNSLRDVYARFSIDVAPLLVEVSQDYDPTNQDPAKTRVIKIAFRILFSPGNTASVSPLESAVWTGDVSGLLVFKDSLELQGPYGTVAPDLSETTSTQPTVNPEDAALTSTTPAMPDTELLTLPAGMPKSCQEIRDAGIGNLDGQYIIEARQGCHLSIICQSMASSAPKEFVGGPSQEQFDYWHYAVLIKLSTQDKENMPEGACLEKTETGRDLIQRIIKAGMKQGTPLAGWGNSVKRMLMGRRKRALDKKNITIMTRPIKIMKETKQRKVRSSFVANWGVL